MKRILLPSAARAQRGLTLVEIIVVLVILALVMSFLGSRLFGAGDKAKVRITQLKIKEIKGAIEQYRLMYNIVPNSLNDLAQCNEKTGPGCVPVLNMDALSDAWGHPFQFSSNGNAFKITSLGADGKSGGDGVNFDVFEEGP